MVALTDFECLSENAKNSLYLAWLSAVDFSQIKEKNNQTLLTKTWANLKTSMYPYFKNQPVSLDDIALDFKTVTFTLNPSLSLCYDPKRGVLIYQLWGFLFDIEVNESECFAIPAFPVKLAGELVHEHEHYLFLKYHELIGKGTTLDYEAEMEQQALDAQVAFLEECKQKVPSSSIIERMKVSKWSIDGKPVLNRESSADILSRAQLIAFIDDQIKVLNQANLEVDEGTYYSETCRIGISHCSDMAKVLSLPTKLDKRKRTYPEITMDL